MFLCQVDAQLSSQRVQRMAKHLHCAGPSRIDIAVRQVQVHQVAVHDDAIQVQSWPVLELRVL